MHINMDILTGNYYGVNSNMPTILEGIRALSDILFGKANPSEIID